MAHALLSTLEPRKTPVQARSAVTVEAIAEATVQVLLSHGAERLTTTRVARRAGVSVGTLYQYYPNKQALLFAVLQDHLDKVSAAVEAACEEARYRRLPDMVQAVVEAYVDAKLERPDVSAALYRVAADIGGPELAQQASRRAQLALAVVLKTAPNASWQQEDFVIQMTFAAMAGATRAVLTAGASPAMVHQLRHHLVLLCQAYMAAVATPPSRQ